MQTSQNTWDVIIVGARCAGASLGALLAARGVRTLILEASPLGTDMVLSTHYMQPPGMDVLDEIGVGDAVRAAAPPVRRFAAIADDAKVVSRYPDDRAGYCIRRMKLDSMLQDAAARAGAELRDHHTVVDLLHDGERVAGVVARTPSGTETFHAGLVVGADGRHSKVAKLTGVEEYLQVEMTRGGYFGYWPRSSAFDDARYDFDSMLAYEGEGLRYIFQTDEDLFVLVGAPPNAVARSWKGDHQAKYVEYLRNSPWTGPLVEGSAPVGKVVGILDATFFARRPIGPGFALLGDAGLFMDFVTGHGMTDALLGARDLASAILDGRPEALEWYWRQRDASVLPLYFDAARLGATGANNALTRLLFRKVSQDPRLRDRLALVADRRIDPANAIPTSKLLGWVLGEALRGRFGAVPEFMQTGRSIGLAEKELASRRGLLREVTERMGEVPRLPVLPALSAAA
jgi:menaquinone-9 beta-reductase